MAFRSYVVTEERARNVRPVLRWVKEAAPRKRERDEATGLLKLLTGVKASKQILLTKGQEEMLLFIFDEFPETVEVPVQMTMWDPTEEYRIGLSTHTRPGRVMGARPELPLPKREVIERPELKTTFTEEEQDERERAGHSRLPQSVPTDAEGVPIADRVSDVRAKIAADERKFGKREVA